MTRCVLPPRATAVTHDAQREPTPRSDWTRDVLALIVLAFVVVALFAVGVAAARCMREVGRGVGWRTAATLSIAYTGPAAILWAFEAAISTCRKKRSTTRWRAPASCCPPMMFSSWSLSFRDLLRRRPWRLCPSLRRVWSGSWWREQRRHWPTYLLRGSGPFRRQPDSTTPAGTGTEDSRGSGRSRAANTSATGCRESAVEPAIHAVSRPVR